MRTRSGPKQGLPEKVTHLLDGTDELLIQRKKSIFDALRKLTSGPLAEEWSLSGQDHEPDGHSRPVPGRTADDSGAKCKT